MLIAVTGATGFLGRYLVRHLTDAGHRLRCWYRPTSDRGGFAPDAPVEWLPGELGDPNATAALVRGVDAVVHSGLDWRRQAGRRFSQQESQAALVETNLIGSLRLMEAAHSIGVPRFVFVSTCAVHDVILDDRPLDEKHPLWPVSHYGAHKAALEKFVHSYGLGQGWAICALRPTGIYGLAHPPQASRWYDLVGQVLAGAAVATDRGGKEVHALDVARAVELLLTAASADVTGQAFNCYDRYVAEEEVARLAQEVGGGSGSIARLNRGPKHQIANGKIRSLGMTFGGEELLRRTVAELVAAHRAGPASNG